MRSFFEKDVTINNRTIGISLRTNHPTHMIIKNTSNKKTLVKKGLHLYPPYKRKKTSMRGSLSIEASLSFSFFTFIVYMLISLIQIASFQCAIEFALHETAKEMAVYGYMYESLKEKITYEPNMITDKAASLLIETTYGKEKIIEKIGKEYLENGPIVGGSQGISLMYSSIMEENAIDLIATYSIIPRFQLLPIVEIPLINRCKINAFVGFNKIYCEENNNETNEEIVYITEKGEVYHKTLECSYLKATTKMVENSDELETFEGRSFRPCSYCCGENIEIGPDAIVTYYGECYHIDPNCCKIHHNILAIPISEVGNRRPCSRCFP